MLDTPHNPRKNRLKMIQLMFETFSVENYYVTNQAVMALYSAGRTTGLVLDAGEVGSNAVPVFEGFQVGDHASIRTDIGGRFLNQHMTKLLQEHAGENLETKQSIVSEIKESLCYVASNYD